MLVWCTTLTKISFTILDIYKHFLCTMLDPNSPYSSLEIHICWKEEREARIDPPIQTEYFLSGGAMIFMVEEVRAVSSFFILSAIPGNMVVPPDRKHTSPF